jgi:Rad3-related DNA helicase
LVKELKNTSYEPIISILASRDQLCVNNNLKKYSGVKKNNMCSALRAPPPMVPKTTFENSEQEQEYKMRMKSCLWDRNYRSNNSNYIKQYSSELLDIEDLFDYTKQEHVCPFYLGRDMLKPAHVVFLPYNYLMNDGFLDTVRDYISGSILIFDEAHNVPSSAAEN